MGKIEVEIKRALKPLVDERARKLARDARVRKFKLYLERHRKAVKTVSLFAILAFLCSNASLVGASPSETDYPRYVVDNSNYAGEIEVPASEPAPSPSYTPPSSYTPPAPSLTQPTLLPPKNPDPPKPQERIPETTSKPSTINMLNPYPPALLAYDRGCPYDPYVINYYDMWNAGWDAGKAREIVWARAGVSVTPPALPFQNTSSTKNTTLSTSSKSTINLSLKNSTSKQPTATSMDSLVVSLAKNVISSLFPLKLF